MCVCVCVCVCGVVVGYSLIFFFLSFFLTASRSWLPQPLLSSSPSPRWGHASVSFSLSSTSSYCLLVWGGEGEEQGKVLNDLHILDLGGSFFFSFFFVISHPLSLSLTHTHTHPPIRLSYLVLFHHNSKTLSCTCRFCFLFFSSRFFF